MGQNETKLPKKTRREWAEGVLENIVDDTRYEPIPGDKHVYENLVLEGGGAKGVGYGGLIKALDDLGVLEGIKRYAGASIGAVVTMLLAIGSSTEEIIEFMLFDDKLVRDAGYFALVPNVIKKFGWYSADVAYQHFRHVIEAKTGNPDLTFEQLYNLHKKELCIIVTNVSSMRTEYCHPKTTPDMPIALAVRMSMALPPIFQPVKWAQHHQVTDFYSDGGILNNYPVQAFDGWYLSMDRKRSFLHMLSKDEPPFGKVNDKTLGAVLFNISEPDTNKSESIRRLYANGLPERPNTRYARKRGKHIDKITDTMINKTHVAKAAGVLIDLLGKNDKNKDGKIDLKELKNAVGDKSCLSDEHFKSLFGQDGATRDVEKIFAEMDANRDNEIAYDEILWFIQKRGISFGDVYLDPVIPTKNITSFFDFMANILDSMSVNSRNLMAKKEDKGRTIGIYTDYIQTSDFELELEDKEYCMKLGWLATVEFFKENIEERRKKKSFF